MPFSHFGGITKIAFLFLYKFVACPMQFHLTPTPKVGILGTYHSDKKQAAGFARGVFRLFERSLFSHPESAAFFVYLGMLNY